MAPTATPGAGELHVGSGELWSIVVPTGWEVVAENDSSTALSRGQAIAEILVAPSSGLTLEKLEAQEVSYLSTWPGTGEIESDVVRLPAGDAVRVTMATTETAAGPRNGFILYVIEEGDTRYAISVRGPHNTDELLTEADALVESFAILD